MTTTKAAVLPVPLEHEEQVALVRWCALHEWHEPRLAMLFAIPNGGPRAKSAAGKLRAEGVRAGAPDLFLAVPGYEVLQVDPDGVIIRAERHGLFIELKRLRGGSLSDDQRMMLHKLRGHGYRAEMCRGWAAAARAIAEYLDRDDLAVGL